MYRLLDKKGERRKIIVPVILIVLFVSIVLASTYLENDTRIDYKLDSTTRRDKLNETGAELAFNTRSGRELTVLNESYSRLDLMPSTLPPNITDSNNLFNYSMMKGEVVWYAMSVVLNNSFGTVKFKETIDLTSYSTIDLDEYVDISSNWIEINSSGIVAFNTTAELTITGLTLNNVRIMKDDDACTECKIISYTSNNVVFDAPGFTIYRAVEGNVSAAIRMSTAVLVTSATMNVSGDTYNNTYPANVTLDLGNDGNVEYRYDDELNTTFTFNNFTTSLNNLIGDCSCAGCNLVNNVTCYVDVEVNSDTQGTVELTDLNISQVIKNITISDNTNYTWFDLNDYFYDRNNGSLIYNYTGVDNITIQVNKTANSSIVSLFPDYNFYGVRYIIFNATDGQNVTTSNNVTINISFTNDAPIYNGTIPIISINRETNYTIDLPGYFSDADNTTLIYNVTDTGMANVSLWNNGTILVIYNNTALTSSSSTTIIFNASDDFLSVNSSNITISKKPLCGDGMVDSGEGCDDGNLADGDGCGSNCQTEGGGGGEEGEGEGCEEGCGDDDPCTTDSCTDGSCEYTYNTASCDDDNICTTGDVCSSGSCSGTAVVCDDDCDGLNRLYSGSCNPLTGSCEYSSETCSMVCSGGECISGCINNLECDDADACTNDVCSDGICEHETVSCTERTRTCSDGTEVSCIPTCDSATGCGRCELDCGEGEEEEEEIEEDSDEYYVGENVTTEEIACLNVTKVRPLKQEVEELSVQIPEGYEMVINPFKLACDDNYVDMTFNIPDDYTDIQALRCANGICYQTEIEKTTYLKCGDKIIEEQLRTTEKLDPRLFSVTIKVENKTLSIEDSSIESAVSNITFVGDMEEVHASVFTPGEAEDEAKNQNIRIIGSPLVVKIDKPENIGIIAELRYNDTRNILENSIAIYIKSEKDWIYVESNLDIENKKVRAEIKDIKQYLDENNEMHIALMGVICIDCVESVLEKIYEPEAGSKDAVLLLHGLGSSPATYQPMIDDIRLTKQPYQLWTFSYSSELDLDKIAEDLSKLLESEAYQFDNMYIVGHSLGGLAVQKALYDSNREGYAFVSKIRKALMIGVPHEGSPGAEAYKNLFKDMINEQKGALYNPNSPALEILGKGMIVPRIPEIEYYVLAGTKSYEFDLVLVQVSSDQLFEGGVKNDGLVSIYSAQNVGGEYMNDECMNYWELQLTHTELIDDPAARKLIGRIIAKDGKASLGSIQYFDLALDYCNPADVIVIIGKKIDKELKREDLTCLCGDGICSGSETVLSCPSDCQFLPAKSRRNVLLIFVLLLLPLLLVYFSRREYEYIILPRYLKEELVEFKKLSKEIIKLISAEVFDKATAVYKKLSRVYEKIIGLEPNYSIQTRLYRKIRFVFNKLKMHREYHEAKIEKLKKFVKLYKEVNEKIAENKIKDARVVYYELKDVYVSIVELRIGYKKENALYRKVKEIYEKLEVKEEDIFDKFDDLKEKIVENLKNGVKAEKLYRKLVLVYSEINDSSISSLRKIIYYLELNSIYKKLLKKRLERFEKDYKRVLRKIEKNDFENVNYMYNALKDEYLKTVGKLPLVTRVRDYRKTKKVYDLIWQNQISIKKELLGILDYKISKIKYREDYLEAKRLYEELIKTKNLKEEEVKSLKKLNRVYKKLKNG